MQDDKQQDGRSAASVRTVELGTALVIFLFGALVAWDSFRLICISGAGTFAKGLRDASLAGESFVEVDQLKLILTVLVPAVIYVSLIAWLGFYVASTLFIAYFMHRIGKYSWLKVAPVAIGVSVAFFLVFEIWFQVPLPKGPLESALGFG